MVNLPTDLREKKTRNFACEFAEEICHKKISGDLLGNLPLSGNL